MDTIENEPANGECGEGCEEEETITVVSSVRILKLGRDICRYLLIYIVDIYWLIFVDIG